VDMWQVGATRPREATNAPLRELCPNLRGN